VEVEAAHFLFAAASAEAAPASHIEPLTAASATSLPRIQSLKAAGFTVKSSALRRPILALLRSVLGRNRRVELGFDIGGAHLELLRQRLLQRRPVEGQPAGAN
jgi:hypothetical protein